MEHTIDQLAAKAGKDPVEYRRALYTKADAKRHLAVMDLATQKAGWGKPLPAGRSRGIALMEGYDGMMAQVAEISLKDGRIKVHKVTVAADIGHIVNPDTVEAQIKSSVVFGMGAGLMQEITMSKGRVEQTNFNNYPVVRMNESPVVDVILVSSTEKPGGIGEPATALVVPAIANALAALTGKRLRKLPLSEQAIAQA
jgi:isoquinoline 1-oxidoreductase beta subunit